MNGVASRLPTPRDISSVDVLFDEESCTDRVVQQRTLVMDRRVMGIPSAPPPPQPLHADRTEETWASDAEVEPSPESTQPARRVLVAEARRWKRALGVAIFVSFAAGIAAAAGTQIALSPTQAASAARARTPASFVASGIRHLEENGTTAKKEAAPVKKQQHRKKKKAAPTPATPEAAETPAEETPADVDANGLLNDGLGQ